ncbi:MAG: peptidoglycan DD-metalloendopeptidase family protein [Candidatus Nanopelagicales bacterium]|nr:peptidoglycan DD-metalloendopeptidase family protein [Candidatus Nanopelagicales bacterium]
MTWLAALLSLAQWLSPVPGSAVSAGYLPPVRIGAPGHRGVDLAAPPGTPVSAIGPGVVAVAGIVAGKPVVTIVHAQSGVRSTYEPVVAAVIRGQSVRAGESIGVLASAGGHCGGHCLHLGIRDLRTGDYRDPGTLTTLPLVVLKPVSRG